MGPKSTDWWVSSSVEEGTQTKEGHVKTEAEVGVTQPQAKEPQEFPGAGLNPGRILLWSR